MRLWPFKRRKLPPVVEEKVENVEKILKKDKKYFIAEYKIVKPLLDEAYEIAHNIHNLALEKRNLKELKKMVGQLNKLERKQRWQQIRVRFPKLREAMSKLLNLPVFNDVSNGINVLLQKEHIFENDSLRQTVEKLDPLIKRKELHEIQWKIVEKTIEVLKADIQALTLLINGLKEKIEEKVG